MTQRDKLIEILSRYFQIGDSYAYNLTRSKGAFAVGTMSLDDFEEFDDFTVADIVEFLLAEGVIVPDLQIGQKVWILARVYDTKDGISGIKAIECEISSVRLNLLDNYFTAKYMDNEISVHPQEIGVAVFLSRDKAEKAISEMSKE